MIASSVEKNQWQEIRNIYIEAFPQKERKPFWVLQHSVKCGKVQIFVETVNNAVQGFIVVIPFKNMIMVDYLAVSAKTRPITSQPSYERTKPEPPAADGSSDVRWQIGMPPYCLPGLFRRRS